MYDSHHDIVRAVLNGDYPMKTRSDFKNFATVCLKTFLAVDDLLDHPSNTSCCLLQ